MAGTVYCKYCGEPGAHPGTQKCKGDGAACGLRCELKAVREQCADLQSQLDGLKLVAEKATGELWEAGKAKIAALTDALTSRCPYHFGEDREDYPAVTHSHLGKHGWTTVQCELTADELRALGEEPVPSCVRCGKPMDNRGLCRGEDQPHTLERG